MSDLGKIISRILLPPLLLYDLAKKDRKKSSTNTSTTTSTADAENTTNKAQNVYNYNYLNDSNTGNTLFSSKQKTKRAIFGGEV